jgi:putative thioredoxin
MRSQCPRSSGDSTRSSPASSSASRTSGPGAGRPEPPSLASAAMEGAAAAAVIDVTEADFDRLVIERSRALPVVVDFWAEWCGPCRTLGPVLERAVSARAGKVELAKVDTDASPALAARYRVQGIPAVKAFREGEVAEEFTGALPQAEVERFLDALVPSEAEQLAAHAAASGDELELRRALALDPRQAAAAAALARLLLGRGEPAEALAVVEPVAATDFACAGLAARARLQLAGDPVAADALSALDGGDVAHGLELLQAAVAGEADVKRRDLLRQVMVGVFTELGTDDPLARAHRRRLAIALS